ncbi:hypothetical protein Tco_0545928 [Tanacetum coccineum]
MEQMTSMCDMVGQLIQKKEEEKRIEEEQAAKDRYWKIPVCYDDDDDEESSIPLKDTIISGLPSCVAITSALSTEKPIDSLIMEDEHLDTIPETESDEFIKSSVENLFPTPSEPEDFSDIESECDVLVCDNLTNFSNPLFDANDDDASSDEEEFKISSNPLFDLDEVSPIDDEVLESITSIPPGIDSFDAESDLMNLCYRVYFSFPPSHIPVEDSDSLIEEIDIFLDGDDSIPPGIESDDFDSEDDDNYTSRPEFESFHVDYPDSGGIQPLLWWIDIPVDYSNKIYDPGICIEVESTRFLATLSPVIENFVFIFKLYLHFSFDNETNVFKHGVLASKDFPDCDDSRARGYVLHSLELHILSFILGIQYPNLFD